MMLSSIAVAASSGSLRMTSATFRARSPRSVSTAPLPTARADSISLALTTRTLLTHPWQQQGNRRCRSGDEPFRSGVSGDRRHPRPIGIDPAPVNPRLCLPADHLIWAARIELVATTLATQIDGSGELQVSPNARPSIVLQV